MKKVTWVIVGILSTIVGLYPIIYFFVDRNFGLLSSKSAEILSDNFWNIAFYGHITFGGLALLVGWLQFSKKLRLKNMRLHRTIGKIYMVSVLISGICGLFISFYATGGITSALGFFSLGVIWLSTTIVGFKSIKIGNVQMHEKFMIISYAACFSAVTLRIWLLILIGVIGEFIPAYKIVAWLSWVPNIIIAYILVRKKNSSNYKPISIKS